MRKVKINNIYSYFSLFMQVQWETKTALKEPDQDIRSISDEL